MNIDTDPDDSLRSLPPSLSDYVLIGAPICSHTCQTANRTRFSTQFTSVTPGGPKQLRLQRLAEQAAGTIDANAAIGGIIATYAPSIDDIIAALTNTAEHVSSTDLITRLARYPATNDHIPKVTAALHVGLLSHDEHTAICTRALRASLLPGPPERRANVCARYPRTTTPAQGVSCRPQ